MPSLPTSHADGAISADVSKLQLWAGRSLSGFATLFLLVDSAMKLVKAPPAVEGSVQLGYPESVVFGLGVLLLVCIVAYAIPRSAVLGAILLTGYLGGAVATHVRVGNPLFSHTLFPVYVGVMIWGGLYLRDTRVRALFLRAP
jgi:DoxX-like family